jgi:hypothetical protein
MKIKSKIPYIALTLTVSSTALVIAAPKHTAPPHVQKSGGHGKTSFGAKGGKQTNLARKGKSRTGNSYLGGQPDVSPTPSPTPTPTPEVSPSPSANPGT